MRVDHDFEKGTIGFFDDNEIERLRYNYKGAPKPYFGPIRTEDGTDISLVAPHDHVWHRGLWFAIKFVDGVNYWEENQEIVGRQVVQTTEVSQFDQRIAVFVQTIHWEDDRDGTTVIRLHELREVYVRLDSHDRIFLHWWSRLTSATGADVVLDRTPFTTWGGYSGLFIRLRNDLEKGRIYIREGHSTDRVTGEMNDSGLIIGNLPGGGEVCALFSVDDCSPQPFYGAARIGYHFFGPAPLFFGPKTIPAREELGFYYQVTLTGPG